MLQDTDLEQVIEMDLGLMRLLDPASMKIKELWISITPEQVKEPQWYQEDKMEMKTNNLKFQDLELMNLN